WQPKIDRWKHSRDWCSHPDGWTAFPVFLNCRRKRIGHLRALIARRIAEPYAPPLEIALCLDWLSGRLPDRVRIYAKLHFRPDEVLDTEVAFHSPFRVQERRISGQVLSRRTSQKAVPNTEGSPWPSTSWSTIRA